MANYPQSLEIHTIQREMASTLLEIPGHKTLRSHGIVRGITVRSRSVVGNFFAGLQTLMGGNISIYSKLCEDAREEAYQLMIRHAVEHGANAVVGVQYDTTEIMPGVTEVIAYGTAVTID